jgi:hypothetical protein
MVRVLKTAHQVCASRSSGDLPGFLNLVKQIMTYGSQEPASVRGQLQQMPTQYTHQPYLSSADL